jgi:hypothetical protein
MTFSITFASRTRRSVAAVLLFAATVLLGGDSPRNMSAKTTPALTVRTVPWLGLPSRPHEVYPGGTIILQGVATEGLTDTPALNLSTATWSFDDGAPNVTSAVGSPLALEANRIFPANAPEGPITATLTVTTTTGDVATDTFKIVVKAKSLDVEANLAIDKGLWYLHKQIFRSTDASGSPAVAVGSISHSSTISATAAATQAMAINNHRTTGNIAEDPYIHDVSRMLRWLEARLNVQAITVQTAGGPARADQPDTNGNNIGLWANDNSVNYIVGQVMDAFVASGTPDQLAVLGPLVPTGTAPNVSYEKGVRNRKYKDLVQDMMDFNSWGQMDVDSGANRRGSWYYTASDNNSTGHTDNSVAQWPAIGGIAGERVWNLTTPAWVKTLNKLAVAWTSNPLNNLSGSPALNMNGSFGYGNSGSSPLWSEGMSSSPSAMVQYVWDGVRNDPTSTDPDHIRYQNGLKWMARFHRIRNPYQANPGDGNVINFYGLYATAKAYRLNVNAAGVPTPITLVDDDTTDSVPAWDWYRNDPSFVPAAAAGPKGMARAVIATQAAAGNWVGASNWTGNLASAWAVIILSPSLFQLGPTAVCTANPNQVGSFGGTVNFNGTGSFHSDQAGTIVSYDWDFGDSTSGSGSTAAHPYPGGAPATFNATLTVTDSDGLTDTTACTVTRVNTNVTPDPNPGGPYSFCPATTLTLNGSGSADEEDDLSSTPLTYAWDLAAPFNYTPADSTAESFDATAFFNTRPPGEYNIVLRVTDSLGVANAEFTTVTVRAANDPVCNQPPDAVNDSATTFSGTAVTVPVLAGDTDPDVPANTLTVTATTQGANGSVTTNGTTATYTPVLGFFGIDTFNYTISDGKGGVDTATVTVTVDRRLASVQAGSGTKVYGSAEPSMSPSSTGFLSTDGITLTQTRAAGDDVGDYATTALASGAMVANYDVTYMAGNLSITPAAVTATAGGGSNVFDGATHSASPCTVSGPYTGDLTCTNDPATVGPNVGTTAISPVVSGSAVGNYSITTVGASYSITAAPVTITAGSGSNVYDGDSHAPSACVVAGSYTGDLACTNGPATVGPDVSTTATTPLPTGSDLANFDVTTVGGSYEIAKAGSITVVTCAASAVYTGSLIEVCSAKVTGVGGLNAEVTPVILTNNVNVGTAGASATFEGDANHLASSGSGGFAITGAPLSVTANNKARSHNAPNPVFDGVLVGVLGADGITATYSSAGMTIPGTYPIVPALVDPNGRLSNYSVTAVNGTLTLTNGAPVAVNDARTGQWNTTLVVAAPGVTSNDTDIDNDSVTATKLTNPTHGTVTLNADGSFDYLPFANYSGVDSFTYQVNDGFLDSNVATVVITITSPCATRKKHHHHFNGDGDDHDRGRNGHRKGDKCDHDRDEHGHDDDDDDDGDIVCKPGSPKTNPDNYTTKKNTVLTVSALKGVRKNDGSQPSTVAVWVAPTTGTVTLAPNGSFVYTPATNFTGTATFYYVAYSSTGIASKTERVTVRITPTGRRDDDDRCENSKHDHDRDNDWKHKSSKYRNDHKDDDHDDDDDDRCENSRHDHRRDNDWQHRFRWSF